MTAPLTRGPELDGIPAAVDTIIEAFLNGKNHLGSNTHLTRFVGLLRDFLACGGKRLRPMLCCCGWQAAGVRDMEPVLPAAASLELFHTFALIHDDVMDGSDTRRGRPTVHRAVADRAHERRGLFDAERFGTSTAILLGDLAMVWSEELFHTSGLPPVRLAAARPVLDAMRSEVMYGQYLDLLNTTDLESGLDASLTVTRFKTAKYTVERPLQLGAALAGAGAPTLTACTAYGIPLGEAFQLRDDVLGVFGDPAVTGKSRLDDLREGKLTPLLALALARADTVQARTLRALVGDPELDEQGAACVREVLRGSGALEIVEAMIDERYRRATESLQDSPFPPMLRATLHELATAATARSS